MKPDEPADGVILLKMNGLKFYDAPDLEGGGLTFGKDFVPLVRKLFGHVGRVYEYCCGPAAIGFSLLAGGLCDSLCLSDVNPRAVSLCRRTATRNRLEAKVSVYLSDCLEQIPEHEKWDLVVSNPPMFRETFPGWKEDIRSVDLNWRIHTLFYSKVKEHLNEGGKILFCENGAASSPETFRPMIESAGLRVESVFRPRSNNLYLFSMIPLWLKSGLFNPFRFARERRLPLPLQEIRYTLYFILTSVAEKPTRERTLTVSQEWKH